MAEPACDWDEGQWLCRCPEDKVNEYYSSCCAICGLTRREAYMRHGALEERQRVVNIIRGSSEYHTLDDILKEIEHPIEEEEHGRPAATGG